ncbi:MAG: hypothetical protein ACOX9C_06805, partial [Kiritimatiellia bacterium]
MCESKCKREQVWGEQVWEPQGSFVVNFVASFVGFPGFASPVLPFPFPFPAKRFTFTKKIGVVDGHVNVNESGFGF